MSETPQGGMTRNDVEAMVLGFINNKAAGDAQRAVGILYQENYDLREAKRKLTQDLEDAKKLNPVDGQVVMSKEDAALLAELKGLGDAKELKKRLEAADATSKELDGLKKDGMLRDVAEAYGYKPSVLSQLAKDLNIETKEVDVQDAQGKTTKATKAFIRLDDKTTVELGEHAGKAWAEFMPSLKSDGSSTSQGTQAPQPQGQGNNWVPQGGGGTQGGGGDLVDSFIQQANQARAAQVNPLLGPAPTMAQGAQGGQQ